MSAEQLVKIAKELLKPNERRGTFRDAVLGGALGGAVGLGGYEVGHQVGSGTKLRHLVKPTAKSALVGAALGGTLGVGIGSIRSGYRKLRGTTSISHAEYTRRKKEAANE